jgi:hypothetical protein
MGGGDQRGLDLLLPVVEIHVGNRVLRSVVIRILIITPVILNLYDGHKSLRTEGYLVPSGTASDHPLV